MNVSSHLCQVCHLNASKYTCPRCKAMYCTLPCYKQHDAECTTQFYSAHVLDTIRNEKATKEESIDMAKKLKAFYDARMKEDEEKDAVLMQQKLDHERLNENLDKLQQLAIQDTVDINDLTQYQQQQFAKALKNGQLNRHIAVWSPWWSPDGGNRSIVMEATDEIDASNETLPKLQQQHLSLIVPPLPVDIAPFESMNAKPPSQLLPFLLCDILCAYVAAMITYNGDWTEEPSQVLQLIVSVSNVLQLNETQPCAYHDFAVMINALMQRCVTQGVKHNKLEILLYLKQVCVLLTKKMNVLRALNQMYELVVIIQHEIVQKSKVSKTLQKKIKHNQKKEQKSETDDTRIDSNTNVAVGNDNYFDAHADQFMQLGMVNVGHQKQNNQNTKSEKQKAKPSYSSSFATEKVRKNVKKKCKSLDTLKRKLWYYLVYCNQFISDDKANLLSVELMITIEHIHSKLNGKPAVVTNEADTSDIKLQT